MSSIVQYFPNDAEDKGSRCGYCKSAKGSISSGMRAHQLTASHYQQLVDRGWRRSGHYVYKMVMKETCCPPYTIKCDTLHFKLSRSQRKVLKTMNKFLTEKSVSTGAASCAEKTTTESDHSAPGRAEAASASTERSAKATEHSAPRPGAGADPNRPRSRKAKDIRREMKAKKDDTAGQVKAPSAGSMDARAGASAAGAAAGSGGAPHGGDGSSQAGKTLEEFVSEGLTIAGADPAHRITTRLIPSDLADADFKRTRQESFKLYCKYQIGVHKDDESELTEKKWERFLVQSPLIQQKAVGDIKYGSFHQHYYLDGKLIAVGVLDILPNALSSVYVYYDTDYPQLTLGTYTALREIMFTRELHRSLPNLCWYYMGFYIHDCPKMVYKGSYAPSLLMCPERLTWVPIEECRPKLNASKYSRLDMAGGDSTPEHEKPASPATIKATGILLPGSGSMEYEMYERVIAGHDSRALVEEYVPLVGPALSRRMLLVIS